MSDPRLAAANRLIADAAIAEIEGRAAPRDANLDRTLALILHVMAEV